MSNKSNIMKHLIIAIVVVVFSVYSIAIIIDDSHKPNGYEMLFLLPLSFLVCYIMLLWQLVLKKKIIDNIPVTLVLLFMLLRNVVTPIYMVKDSYVSSLGIPSAEYINKSIFLITFETVIMSFFLFYFECKEYQNNEKRYMKMESLTSYRFILYSMIAICIVSFIAIPQFRSQYYTIFTKDITHLVHEETNYNVGSAMRILATLSEVCIGAVRLIVPSSIIYHLSLNGQSKKNLGLSILCVLSQVLFMNDSNAFILMLMVSQFLFLYRLYPKYQKLIVRGVSIFSLGFIILLYLNRFATDHYGKSFSLFLQSYLPSVANASGIYNMEREHDMLQIFKDIFVAIPFKSTLGYRGNVMSTNVLWGVCNQAKGQIMPNVAQSYYYFGSIFSPLLSCVCIYISIKINKKLKTENNVIKYAALQYIMVYAAAVPFVYNTCIFMQCFLQRMIFMLIVAVFAPYRLSDIKHLQKGKDQNHDENS